MTKFEPAQAGILNDVRAFWETEACGSHFVKRARNDRDFFREYREFRYRTEWHIPEFVASVDVAGKDVLEIGCGNGTDGVLLASSGARYTGVDLTPEAVDATRRHFAVAGQDGNFCVEDCERLRFADESFDVVYSFGVLHHTPTPATAVREVYRVLKPGGTALVMLYHRRSFNYYVRILGWMRARLACRILARAGHRNADRAQLASRGLRGLRGNASPQVWDIHYANFLRDGWAYLKADNFVHHATDGPECPRAFVYSRREAVRLFSHFRSVETQLAHLPLNKYPFARWLPRGAERLLASCIGWHLLIRATK